MKTIYDAARIYDIAFGWRDVQAECDFMLECFKRARKREAVSVLEVACGPGQHTRQFAARGLQAIGIDINAKMIEYAKSQPGGDDSDVTWLLGDMRDFKLARYVEMAFCLVDSLSHLLTLDELLAHLACTAEAVMPGGLYILEQSHPRDAFGHPEPGIESAWEIEDESGEILVASHWGEVDDLFDYTSQIGQMTVTTIASRDGKEFFREQMIIPSRLWLAGEIEAAIRASKGWRLRERFGAMNSAIAWQSEPPASRMVTVLERIEARG